MKERPILFSAAMVRAILSHTKSQTRRAMKPQPPADVLDFCTFHNPKGEGLAHFGFDPLEQELQDWFAVCPYGQVGDRLWVRETFSGPWCMEAQDGIAAAPPSKWGESSEIWYWSDGEPPYGDWTRPRPSMFMPRWASRITLEVTDVRVERLQDISEADAKAEGCERLSDDEPGYVERDEPDWKLCPQCGGTRLYTSFNHATGGATFDTDCQKCDTYAKRYQHLWESINGPGSWDANPWVWAVSFRRVEQAA